MNLSEASLKDLETIDHEQLCASANRIAQKLLSGNHQGSRGLEKIFTETFEAWTIQTGLEKIDLVLQFLESNYFEKYHEVPFVGKGYCIEQAFYEFIKEVVWPCDNPLEGIVRNEFLVSIFKTLSKMVEPNFYLDSGFVKSNSASKYSVQLYQYRLVGDNIKQKPHFVLYAAYGGQFVSGEITPLIADILYYESKNLFHNMGEILKRHNVSVTVFFNTYKQMVDLGVIPNAA